MAQTSSYILPQCKSLHQMVLCVDPLSRLVPGSAGYICHMNLLFNCQMCRSEEFYRCAVPLPQHLVLCVPKCVPPAFGSVRWDGFCVLTGCLRFRPLSVSIWLLYVLMSTSLGSVALVAIVWYGWRRCIGPSSWGEEVGEGSANASPSKWGGGS